MNGLQQRDATSPLLFSYALEYDIGRFMHTRRAWNKMGQISFWSVLMLLIYLAKVFTL